MSALEIYAAEYPGDDAWTAYARTNGVDNGGIHDVANALLGDQAHEWFATPSAALENSSPQEVLAQLPNGEIIIRSLLMRLPQ